MKIYRSVRQGSQEWLSLRSGIPTASCFDQIVTKGGAISKSSERYMYTLLAERLMGHPVVEHVSMWMNRGSEMERDAVSFYELQRDCETVPVGFVSNDEGTIGASPDRLVGEDGQLETKVPSEWIHVGYMLKSGAAYDAYKVQVQGQLWITGRQWSDVLSWHPELPPALVRIERDEPFIELLAKAITKFSQALEEQFMAIVEMGVVKARARREPSIIDMLRDSLIEVNRERAAQ